jgi:trehalose 6-phosphate synthase/phosphatase
MNTKETEAATKNLIIVSNRLPLQISINDDHIDITPSVGGLATGMKSVYKTYNSKWIGWPGFAANQLPEAMAPRLEKMLLDEGCLPVYLSEQEIEQYYYGFTNETIWPLFHYFTQYCKHDQEQWESFVKVNQKFAEKVLEVIKPGDTLWIHDYHLLLLPQMIREKCSNISIGFFLHIPFPSYEVFRILPWREKILEGMLGADLIGFHTYDYERHFISCVRRLLGYDVDFNRITLENRIAKVDAFPMGIDYERFSDCAVELQAKLTKDRSKLQQEIDKYFLSSPDRKLVLSIDRLDYTKGIPNRIRAYERFLDKYPQYREKVSLIMLTVPSRTSVDTYKNLKSEIDELVGRINGQFGSINWTPIWYFYRSMPFENLVELYSSSEIALLTPLRDGMNLVAKEYIATKTNKKGVLIMSEMAGAAKEMGEAIIINPENIEETADAIKQAYEMPDEKQKEMNGVLQARLKRYNVQKWAQDFIQSLDSVECLNKTSVAQKLTPQLKEDIAALYNKAKNRYIFLDYDGTLVGFKNNPKDARPDQALYDLLDGLSADKNTTLILISGRDKETFSEWFADRTYTLIAEHGLWLRLPGKEWALRSSADGSWKEVIRPILEFYVDRTPGTFIEEKNFSLVWHYRKSDPELGSMRARELKDELTSFIANHNLEILEGNKVIEIKISGVNKGTAAEERLLNIKADFILCMGDDWTDEHMFEHLPSDAYTVKVGNSSNTKARYTLKNHTEVRNLLEQIKSL